MRLQTLMAQFQKQGTMGTEVRICIVHEGKDGVWSETYDIVEAGMDPTTNVINITACDSTKMWPSTENV